MNKILAFLSLATVSGLTLADSVQPYDGSTAYININTGFATMQGLPTGSWTGNLNAGYNFNRAFALEGGYNLFANNQFGATTTTSIFDIAAKGTIPLSQVFNLYGRFGIGLGLNGWSGTTDTTNCELCQSNNSTYMLGLAGIGGSFTLDRHFDLRLEDTMYVPFANTFTGSTINAITLGIQYNF